MNQAELDRLRAENKSLQDQLGKVSAELAAATARSHTLARPRVQGGYSAPSGGAKPPAPTTGSGVMPAGGSLSTGRRNE